MKIKVSKGFANSFSSKVICMITLVILCGILPTLSVHAQEQSASIMTENYNLISQYSTKLDETVAYYTDIDESSEKSVSISVAEAINAHRTSLFELHNDQDINKRILTDKIEAAYSRAKAGGRLAWLYYYNITSVSVTDSIEKINAQYSLFSQEIFDGTDSAVIDARANVICTEFNRMIYIEKAKGLANGDDSIDASALIAGAINSMEKTSSPDLFGENFAEIFSNLTEELKLQRARDNLSDQLSQVFPIIYPEGSFNSNEVTTLFIYNIKNAKTVGEMNKSLTEAIYGLTEPKIIGVYSSIYIQGINLQIADTANRATAENTFANIVTIFKDYTLDYKRALTKDNIRAVLFNDGGEEHQILKDIESRFNAAQGSLDACQTTSSLENELICANYIRRIFDEKHSASQKLSIFLGGYDPSAFEARLEDIRKACSEALWEKKKTSQSLEAESQIVLNNAMSEISAVLNEAKAERFLLDNKAILQKSKENLALSDELALKSALTEYTRLENSVQSALRSQIENIAEKYNILLCNKARSLLNEDALYLDLCEIICTEIKNISAENIELFYNNCNRTFKKSEFLRDAIIYYRQITENEIYSEYTTQEKQDLSGVCQKMSAELSKISSSDPLDFEDKLSELLSTAKLSADKIHHCARIRIRSRNSKSASVQALIAEAKAKIALCTSQSEIISASDKAIFKIERELTKEAIVSKSDELKLSVSKMEFLTEEERSLFLASIKSVATSSTNDAGAAENVTVLNFIWSVFVENLSEIDENASKKDLARGLQSYTSLFDSEIAMFKSKLGGMAHLSSQRRDEFLNSSTLILAQFKANSALCQSSNSLASVYSSSLEQLYSLEFSANSENVINYKSVIKEKLEAFKALKENYSVENYNKLQEEILKALQNLSSCQSISECNNLLDAVSNSVMAIDDLLDEAISSARAKLDATIRSCRANSSLYSQSNMLDIENLYNTAIKKISSYTNISDIKALNEYLSSALALINSVQKDIIFSSDEACAITNPNPQYPVGYKFDKGYWGSVSLSNGIISDAVFSIKNISNAYNPSAIQSAIRKAAKENKLILGDSISENTLKALRKCVVSLGIDISLSKLSSSSDLYTVKMLLPSSLLEENILGIAFIGESNNVEFYSIQQADSLISFDLSHFSNYYIVSENTTNLVPLIIFLTVLLSLELLVLLLVALFHFNRKRKEKNMFPLLSSLSLNPFLFSYAIRVLPQNGVAISLLLSIAALALGCGIAFLTKLELDAMRLQRLRNMSKNVENSTDIECSTKIESPEKLVCATKTPVLCGATMSNTEFLLESDEDFEFIKEDSQADLQDTSPMTAIRKAEINLDVIAEAFEAGELVNLETLKKKRLISKRTDYIKILARGTLTKPLVVEAHDFSHAAKEMLIAVGGEAIKVK